MADILSQEEINDLSSAVDTGSPPRRPLTQQEIEALLNPAGDDPRAVLVRWLTGPFGLGASSPVLLPLLLEIQTAVAAAASPAARAARLAALLRPHARPPLVDDGPALAAQVASLLEHLAEARPANARAPGLVTTAYDFKHPARVNKDQLRALESLHDNFARLLSSTLSGAMRTVVDVDTAFVDQTTYAEFIMSLSNPSCSYQFALGSTLGPAIIDLAMPLVFAFVDRIFGGQGSSEGVEARQVTPIEIGVINRILKRVIEDLEATWEPLVRTQIIDIELETNPEFMQIAPASEIVVLLAFEVNQVHASGLVSLCYPFFTLERLLPRLGQRTYDRARQPVLPTRRDRLGPLPLDVVGPVPVPLHVELGQASVPLSAARRLAVGDLLMLDTRTDDPCVVYVGDRPKYYGQVYADGDSQGVEICGRFPRELYGTRGLR